MAEHRANHESPAELLQRAMTEYESGLIGYAMSILGDLERSRDAVQDTFLKLYQQEEGSVTTALKSWLFTVCRNRCLDILRKEKRIVELEDERVARLDSNEPTPAEAIQSAESHTEVLQYLDRLPENQREVIRLKFQNDLSYQEISDVTDLSVGNVGFLLHTGLKRLRQLLAHRAV